MNLFYLAKHLQGDIISSKAISCPAPGKPLTDRSVTVTLKTNGWSVETTGNDPEACADHVRAIMLEAVK